jgi:integrase
VISKAGGALTTSGLDNGLLRAWIKAAGAADQASHAALAARIWGFQFRDLRAKTGTEKADSDGLVEAKHQVGHSSVEMTEHYVRPGQIIPPTTDIFYRFLRSAPQKRTLKQEPESAETRMHIGSRLGLEPGTCELTVW